MPDDDIFDIPEEDEGEAPKQNNQLQAAQRKLAKAEKELEELRTFRAEREKVDRGNAVLEAAKGLGINAKHAAFYQGEDTTADAIKAWAVENEFLVPAEGDDEPAPAAPTGYTPTDVSGGTAPGSKIYEFDEWMKLSQTDPALATKLWNSGRVAESIRD